MGCGLNPRRFQSVPTLLPGHPSHKAWTERSSSVYWQGLQSRKSPTAFILLMKSTSIWKAEIFPTATTILATFCFLICALNQNKLYLSDNHYCILQWKIKSHSLSDTLQVIWSMVKKLLLCTEGTVTLSISGSFNLPAPLKAPQQGKLTWIFPSIINRVVSPISTMCLHGRRRILKTVPQ